MRIELAVGTLGLVSVAKPLWTEVAACARFARAVRSEPRPRLRNQIRAQYRAEVRVRRELTLDPWFGRGGRFLFDPNWTNIEKRG